MSKKRQAWGCVAVWAGLIFFVSHLPSLTTNLGIWDLILRKTAHMVEFGILALFLIRALRLTWPQFKLLKVLLWGCGLAVIYAVSDEFHQYYVPGRVCSLWDVVFDSLGILFVGFYCGVKNSSHKKIESNI